MSGPIWYWYALRYVIHRYTHYLVDWGTGTDTNIISQVSCSRLLSYLHHHCMTVLNKSEITSRVAKRKLCITISRLVWTPCPPLDNIWVMVIVWRLRRNIMRTAVCWIVWHNVHSPQHTYMSSSYRFNRLGLSHWDPYAVCRGRCLELYYCNMVEWFWWDSSLISTTNWFPSVLWHCWFGYLAC